MKISNSLLVKSDQEKMRESKVMVIVSSVMSSVTLTNFEHLTHLTATYMDNLL